MLYFSMPKTYYHILTLKSNCSEGHNPIQNSQIRCPTTGGVTEEQITKQPLFMRDCKQMIENPKSMTANEFIVVQVYPETLPAQSFR